MNSIVHKIYISILVGIVVIVTTWLFFIGWDYYQTPLSERFYHPSHDDLKPSGKFGHGIGILGTLLVIIGVVIYIARKRYKILHKYGRLKHWLEFHIFLCTLGPIMILFHTAFKFGGLVSISFWSMVAVVLSGIIGRFIYIQIPRSIEGRELSLHELEQSKNNLENTFKEKYLLKDDIIYKILSALERPVYLNQGFILKNIFKKHWEDRKTVLNVKKILKNSRISRKDTSGIIKILTNEISLDNKISRLQQMQTLFRYWHVAHLPFALIMFIILVIHVGVTLAFGYKWIF